MMKGDGRKREYAYVYRQGTVEAMLALAQLAQSRR